MNFRKFKERRLVHLLLFGFFVAVTIAWYHGEQGRQRVSGPELLILAGIFGLSGFVLWYVENGENEAVGSGLIGISALSRIY